MEAFFFGGNSSITSANVGTGLCCCVTLDPFILGLAFLLVALHREAGCSILLKFYDKFSVYLCQVGEFSCFPWKVLVAVKCDACFALFRFLFSVGNFQMHCGVWEFVFISRKLDEQFLLIFEVCE